MFSIGVFFFCIGYKALKFCISQILTMIRICIEIYMLIFFDSIPGFVYMCADEVFERAFLDVIFIAEFKKLSMLYVGI